MSEPCAQGLFRLPHIIELAVLVWLFVFLTGVELLFWFVLRVPTRLSRIPWAIGFQLALLFIRSDVRLGLLALYLFWVISRNWPWKKWRNKATQRLEGFTEIARAAIQRQEREALS